MAEDEETQDRETISLRVVMDRDLMVQIDTLARDRRLDRDRIIEIALRNLLSLHDWPASPGSPARYRRGR
jgi:predicted transcriptional regulator